MSLWTEPQRRSVKVDLERFRDYEHFHDSVEQYVDLEIPQFVEVRWEPIKKFLIPLDGDQEEEEAFVQSVADRIEADVDVPPILLDQGEVFDGRHRAWAAYALRMKKVPVAEIGQYWTSRR